MDYIMHQNNYTTSDIEEMEIEEYDFIFNLCISQPKQEQNNGI